MNIRKLNEELKNTLKENNLNADGKFLFRDYGLTAEEVFNTIDDAIQFIEEHEEHNIADSLKDVRSLLEKLWYE